MTIDFTKCMNADHPISTDQVIDAIWFTDNGQIAIYLSDQVEDQDHACIYVVHELSEVVEAIKFIKWDKSQGKISLTSQAQNGYTEDELRLILNKNTGAEFN